mgnify:CR=1 FL=1
MPEDTITRAELAVMLYRYAQLLKLDTATSGGELSAFAASGRREHPQTAAPEWEAARECPLSPASRRRGRSL